MHMKMKSSKKVLAEGVSAKGRKDSMTEIMNGVWTKGLMRKIVQRTIEFYKDPENRKEFQAWLDQKRASAAEETDHPAAAVSE